MAAGELKAGDSLFCYSGEKVKLDSVFTFNTDTATAVYNLEASGNHNYYVSASKVLVHNKNPKLLVKSFVEQTDDLVKLNSGKNSVTIKTNSGHIRYDLQGKAHGAVSTPHKQIYQNNYKDGILKSTTRANKHASPMTQQDIRTVKRYLIRKSK